MDSGLNSTPLVSISCITFNHVNFIQKALTGFLMQKTNFKFEVLIHDDASKDGTEEIIRDFERRFPSIIKPLYEAKNQWKKGRKGSAVFNFPRAKGKYIALCEGDDYWTDPLKLQKQVDFLEANKTIALAAHNVQIVGKEFNEIIDRPYHNQISTGIYNTEDIIKGFKLPTNSILFRNHLYDFKNTPKWSSKIRSGDKYLYLMLSTFGDIYYDNTIMGAYRKHEGGIVGSYDSWSYQKHILIHNNQIFFWRNFKEFFHPKYQKDININIAKEYADMSLRSLKNQEQFFKSIPYIYFTYWHHKSSFTKLWAQLIPIFQEKINKFMHKQHLNFRIFGSKIKQSLMVLFRLK